MFVVRRLPLLLFFLHSALVLGSAADSAKAPSREIGSENQSADASSAPDDGSSASHPVPSQAMLL